MRKVGFSASYEIGDGVRMMLEGTVSDDSCSLLPKLEIFPFDLIADLKAKKFSGKPIKHEVYYETSDY